MLRVRTLLQCTTKAASGEIFLYAASRIRAKRRVSQEERTDNPALTSIFLLAAAAYKRLCRVDEHARALPPDPWSLSGRVSGP